MQKPPGFAQATGGLASCPHLFFEASPGCLLAHRASFPFALASVAAVLLRRYPRLFALLYSVSLVPRPNGSGGRRVGHSLVSTRSQDYDKRTCSFCSFCRYTFSVYIPSPVYIGRGRAGRSPVPLFCSRSSAVYCAFFTISAGKLWFDKSCIKV